MNATEIMSVLEHSGALLAGHFELASGKHSDRYILMPQLFQYPDRTGPIAAALADLARHLDIETVVGPATGGIILSYEVARALGKRAIFAEKAEGGGFAIKRGFRVRAGERVLAVEDAVTTGGSVSGAIQAVRQLGADVVAVAAIVDRSGGRHVLDVPLISLVQLDVKAYEPADCPLCARGVPVTRPKQVQTSR